ncbi:carbohydrate ABC transporter permease [Microbacterium sp. CIAB417]|uniref:carbohydrate ABC transporter permease n=1 Tax=Microbacterium sp. CIAB417 TaxID=2860287 RepID=UPI001FACDF2E|nr:sugar ABC transporter permease [Microbacterium sp. CIAB417]
MTITTDSTVTLTVPPESRRRNPVTLRGDGAAAVGFLSPMAIGVLLFIALPAGLSIVMSLCEVTFGGVTFVGLANYQRMLGDPLFWQSLGVTAVYALAFVPGLTILSLSLALLVHTEYLGVGLWRALLLAPNAISLVATALVWRFILADGNGTIAIVANALGVPAPSWLGDPGWALFTVIAISLWSFMGFYMLVMVGGRQDIPAELYEAARIDGAGAWAQFWRITLPMMRPTVFFVVLMGTVIGLTGLQSFDLVFVMTKGGPANATSLTIYYIYQQAFQYGQFGYAAAMSTVLTVIMFTTAAVFFRVTNSGRFDVDG